MQDNNLPIKTGNQAEKFVAETLANTDIVWVGNFNKSNSGSQPFDQIAITQLHTWCYDVKNCNIDRFDFSRVEDNQEISLGFIDSLDNPHVYTGFAIVFDNEIYFLSTYQLNMLKAEGRKSVKVTTLSKMLSVILWNEVIIGTNYTKQVGI